MKNFALFFFLIFCINVLAGCQSESTPSSFDNSRHNDPKSTDEIILKTSQIVPVKIKRYQPSFKLSGVIAPAQSVELIMPTEGQVSYLADDANVVQSGDIIAKLTIEKPFNASIIEENSLLKNADYDPATQTYSIKAPFTGKIIHYASPQEHLLKNAVVLDIVDNQQFKFISFAPIAARSYLKIGESVNFNLGQSTHSGQVSQVTVNNEHLLRVHVLIGSDIQDLKIGQAVSGRVEYGQIDTAALIPNEAIFNEQLQPFFDHELLLPPHKPSQPISAVVWTIGQDEIISLNAVKIIEYLPKTQQYLVTGVNNNALLVASLLPLSANGKRVQLK